MHKSVITILVAQSLQEWVLNKFKDGVLMKLTPHATIVAATEVSGDKSIMDNSQAPLAE